MKRSLYFTSLLVLLLTNSSLFAFQQPSPVVQKYGSIEKATGIMEKHAYAGEFSNAIEVGILIRDNYRLQKKTRELNFINQELLLFQILRQDIDSEEKEANIQKFYEKGKVENDPYLEQICQAATAHLMLNDAQLERFDHHYNKAIEIAKGQEDYSTIRALNVNIATEYFLLENWKPAREYIHKAEEALNLEKTTPTQAELGSFHNARAIIYYNTSEYDKALKSALYNLQALEKSEGDQTIALLYDYNNLASIYTGLGEEENAFIYHKKALEILPKTKDYPIVDQAILYYNISESYKHSSSNTESILYAKKALETLSLIDDKEDFTVHSTYAFCYHNLADLFINEEKIDSGSYYLAKAEDFLPLAPMLLTQYYKYKADIEFLKGNYEAATLHNNRSQKEVLKNYGSKDSHLFDSFINYIKISLAKKEYRQSIVYAQKTLESISINFSDPDGYTNPAVNDILQKNHSISALNFKLKGLTNLYKQNNSPEVAQAIFSTTRFATQVLEHLSKEFKNPNTKRRWLQEKAIPLFEKAIAAAVNIANTTGNKKYLQDAFELSERSKSMLMTDMLQEQHAATAGGVPESLIEQLQALKRALYVAEKKRFDAIATQETTVRKEAENQIFKINQDLDVLKRRFEQDYPKYYKLKYDDAEVSLADIQAALEPNSMLLEYFEGDEKVYIFSVYQDHIVVTSFEHDKPYKHLFKRFSQSLISVQKFVEKPVFVFNEFVKDARKLYQYLIAPVDMKGIKRLIIIPDGQLSYLPFEVLLSDDVELIENEEDIMKANFTTLPYLLHDVSTNYNYSGRLWLERNLLSKKAVNNNILALAPKYNNLQLPDWRGQREVDLRKKLTDLPGAVEEVKRLSEHYAGTFLSGDEANEALLKKEAANYGILHLAMHGLVNSKSPEFSGLALTEDNNQQEDNFLYAYEIEQLPIQSSLIVLSACETGIGRFQRGEGVVSIGRSFVYAGAPSLLMTLWKLNDQSGAFIIEEFYKNLYKGLEKDEAIRQAKLQFLTTFPQEYAHPFLWAAFVQVGSYDSITIAANTPWITWGYYGFGVIGIFSIILFFYIRRNKEN